MVLQYLPLRPDGLWKDIAGFCHRLHFLPDEMEVAGNPSRGALRHVRTSIDLTNPATLLSAM
ncbi:MAG TPA: hypothetical protein PLR25_23885 [Planctomycetaceae bacterium]|nr:hypothetical protein [Planctomycetaceae bacterium]